MNALVRSAMRGVDASPAEAGAPGPARSRVGYVMKVYPRFSETFIVNEVLAHERAGLDVEIFSLRPPVEGRFHEALARVAAPVTYVEDVGSKPARMWQEIAAGSRELPGFLATVTSCGEEDPRAVYQAFLVARAVRERGITHLHAHFGNVATTVARLAGRLAGIPYSFTGHAKDIFHESVDRDDLRHKLRDAAAAVTVSDHNVRVLRELCPDAAVHRVYNGLSLQDYRFGEPWDRPARIVAVGRLVEKKGFGDLIHACALLRDRGRDFRCEIAGMGLLEMELRGRIERAGLHDRVRLLGPTSGDEVRRLMRSGAVFAAPCVVSPDGDRDGLPTVLLEAMALGTPCVSTDVTGIPEVLRHQETGLQVPQRSPVALADALEALLDDPTLRVRIARAARRLIEEQFDIDRNGERLRRLFAGIHERRVAPAA